jgi:phosphoribosyl isomerase A
VAALSERGIDRFVYTPVDVDGLMEGPDIDSLRALAQSTDAELIYSGGVGSLDDLRAIAALELENLDGVIVGRALYEGRLNVTESQAALE